MSESSSSVSLETIQEWLENHYNSAMATYLYDDHVRLTNGSAGYFIDIYINNDGSLTLTGQRYSEDIDKTCDATEDALTDTLSKTI